MAQAFRFDKPKRLPGATLGAVRIHPPSVSTFDHHELTIAGLNAYLGALRGITRNGRRCWGLSLESVSLSVDQRHCQQQSTSEPT